LNCPKSIFPCSSTEFTPVNNPGEAGCLRDPVPAEPWNTRERAVLPGKSEPPAASSSSTRQKRCTQVPGHSTIWYASRRWRVPLEERSLREREYLIPATAEALRDAHDANAPTPARSFRVGVPGCWSWLLRKVILLRGLEENRDDGSCCGVPVSQVDRHHSVDRGGQSLDDPAGLFSDLGHHLSRVDLVA
jgi:hypothetical protein